MKYLIFLFILALINKSAIAQKPGVFSGQYPESKTSAVADDFFGIKVTDPYRWLENDTATDTKDWVQSENAVTQQYLTQIPFRSAIKERLTSFSRQPFQPANQKLFVHLHPSRQYS